MRCKAGTHCENGDCVPDVVVNPCALILCKENTICDKGNCIPIPSKCSTNEECGLGQKCSIGVCVDKCSGVSCSKS